MHYTDRSDYKLNKNMQPDDVITFWQGTGLLCAKIAQCIRPKPMTHRIAAMSHPEANCKVRKERVNRG